MPLWTTSIMKYRQNSIVYHLYYYIIPFASNIIFFFIFLFLSRDLCSIIYKKKRNVIQFSQVLIKKGCVWTDVLNAQYFDEHNPHKSKNSIFKSTKKQQKITGNWKIAILFNMQSGLIFEKYIAQSFARFFQFLTNIDPANERLFFYVCVKCEFCVFHTLFWFLFPLSC